MALPDRTSRRRFAGVVAAVVGAGLAGCTGGSIADTDSPSENTDSPSENTDSPAPENTPISEECERDEQELPDLRVQNRHSDAHVVDLTVTGKQTDGSNEPFYKETFDLEPETEVGNPDSETVRWVAFDPDAEDIERYDDFVATATIDSGTNDSRTNDNGTNDSETNDTEGIYSTVVSAPLRYGLLVEIHGDRELTVTERHVDPGQEWEPGC